MITPKNWFDNALESIDTALGKLREFGGRDDDLARYHANYFLGAISASCSILTLSEFSSDAQRRKVIARLHHLAEDLEKMKHLHENEILGLVDLMLESMIELDENGNVGPLDDEGCG